MNELRLLNVREMTFTVGDLAAYTHWKVTEIKFMELATERELAKLKPR